MGLLDRFLGGHGGGHGGGDGRGHGGGHGDGHQGYGGYGGGVPPGSGVPPASNVGAAACPACRAMNASGARFCRAVWNFAYRLGVPSMRHGGAAGRQVLRPMRKAGCLIGANVRTFAPTPDRGDGKRSS